MTAVVAVQRGGDLWLWCPACDQPVRIGVQGPNAWTWNGDVLRPHVMPSILTKGPGSACHSYLSGGVWKYLQDCTHEHAGQDLDAVPFPADQLPGAGD